MTDVIYDWSSAAAASEGRADRRIELVDSTLRDGAQSPSARTLRVAEKLEILHSIEQLGVQVVDIGSLTTGAPGSGDAERLLREISAAKMRVRPIATCLVPSDLTNAADLSQRTGQTLTVYVVAPSSLVRLRADGASLELVTDTTRQAIAFAAQHGLASVCVADDAGRSTPETLQRLFETAISAGARGLCVCDSAGQLTLRGLSALGRFIAKFFAERGAPPSTLDWQGCNDRGLALALALSALDLGFDRVHGSVLGLGDRSGGAPLELIIANLRTVQGGRAWPGAVTKLADYVNLVSRASGIPVPTHHPVFGRDAFRTASGARATAIVNARQRGDLDLAARVSSGMPCVEFGRAEDVEIGPISDASNVSLWLAQRKVEGDAALGAFILESAKRSQRVLSEEEVRTLIRDWQRRQAVKTAVAIPFVAPAKPSAPSAWISRLASRVPARVRLFCFPYAGGGASAYHGWNALLPPAVEVCALQLPGREARHVEAKLTSLSVLLEQLLPQLCPYLDLPYAFFGHSMGALLAFEVTRALRLQRQHQPTLLVASGRMAPDRGQLRAVIHGLPDQELLAEIRRFGGTPSEVLENRELMAHLLPILRADLTLTESYRYSPAPPLDCPIVAFGGEEDASVSREDLAAWGNHTRGGFSAEFFRGGHFFLRSERAALTEAVSRVLLSHFPGCRLDAGTSRLDGGVREHVVP